MVVHFPKLIWFLTFAVTCAPRGFERPKVFCLCLCFGVFRLVRCIFFPAYCVLSFFAGTTWVGSSLDVQHNLLGMFNMLILILVTGIVDVGFIVAHDSCSPWKHLLARRGYVELVPVVCILHQMV